MLRTIVVDDEPVTRKRIGMLLENYHDLVVVGSCGSVADAMILVPATAPDLLFLDINLQDGTGFDLLEALPTLPFHIIFITAYDEYAIKAIKYGALDYLLKPIDQTELSEAVEKARTAWLPEKDVLDSVDLIRSYWTQPAGNSRQEIVLKSQTSLQKVTFDEIVYCQSQGNYTHFHLKDNKRIVVSRTLKEFQEMLPSQLFVRPHHSFLVNVKFIERFDYHRDYLILKTGEDIPVSIRKKQQVMALYQQA